MHNSSVWPKTPPTLSPEQKAAREAFMFQWLQILPARYGFVEEFNQGYVAKLPIPRGSKTLEIGAGIGAHLAFEDLKIQDYHCLELKEERCAEIRKTLPAEKVHLGNIEERQSWDAGTFDRIVAIHILEHICNLPRALEEVSRLMKADGVFDIVLPTEGGLAYTIARKISAERLFRKKFKMDYTPIVRNEHVNTFAEIRDLLDEYFEVETATYYPLPIPIATLNLCVGMRLKKRNKS